MVKSFRVKIQKLMGIPQFMLIALMATVFVFGLFHPDSFGELESVWSPLRRVVTLLCGIALFLMSFILLTGGLGRLRESRQRAVLGALTAVAFGVQLFLVLRYPLQIWWDNTSVLTSAISIVTGEKSWFDVIYFNQVGHQNCFLLLTTLLCALAEALHIPLGGYTLYFSLVDLAAMDLAVLFTVLLTARIKSPSAARKVWLLALACPGLYLWAGYYYTTNLSLFFIAVYCYLIRLAWEKKRSPLFYILLGIFTAFGMQLRMTMLLFVVATVLYACFRLPKAPLRAALFTAAGLAAMLFVLRFSYLKLNPDYSEDARFPVTHWLMMAAQGNGEYNDEDLAFTSSFPTKEEKAQATRDEYFRRLRELGVVGCLKLAIRKTTHNWSYGNHSYYPLFHRYDRLSDVLWTPDHKGMFYWEQVYHLAMLLLVLVQIAGSVAALVKDKGDSRQAEFDAFLQIALTGGFCFYILWETFPYYSVGFLTVFWALSADGLEIIGKMCAKAVALTGRNRRFAFAAAGVAAAAALAVIASSFIQTPFPPTVKPVVTQKKMDRMLSMRGAKKAKQTFIPSRSFDTISFWISKEQPGQPGGGLYDIVISCERLGEVFRESYDTRNLTMVDEFTRSFPEVSPLQGETFTISIEEKETEGDNPLNLGGYDLPVEAYLYGDFSLDGTRQSGELFFTVTLGGPDGVIRLYD